VLRGVLSQAENAILGKLFQTRFGGIAAGAGGQRKSLEKRRENPLARHRLGMVWKTSIRYMIRTKN